MLRLWLLVLSGAALAVAAQPGLRVQAAGGTLPGIPAKASLRLDLTSPEFLLVRAGASELRIEYRKVNTVEYGQNVSRRYAAAILISPVLLLSKSRKHFVTLGFLDGDGRQQALVLRVDKGDIRAFLAGLEARTGRRVEYTDDDARRSGK